jgi:hypothetical protein
VAAAQEDDEEPAAAVIAPPVITVVPVVHKAAWQEAAAQVAAVREDVEPAVIAPPLITVVPGARESAAQEAAAQEASTQVSVAHGNTENTPPPTKRARNTPPPTKRARGSPAQQDAEGVSFVDNHSGVSHELTASPLGHDVSSDLFCNILLNVNHNTRKFMIIKLVSHSDICRSIEEVLWTTPIVSQATYNKSAVNWEECTPPYAVDQRAFRNHTHGKKKGLPRDSDPNTRTNGERLALSRAKKKVLKAFVGIGTLE